MNRVIIAILGILVLVGGLSYLNRPQRQTPARDTEETNQNSKSFQSKLMKFSITVPKELVVEERSGQVTIYSSVDKIYIDRNGTNFANLDDYLEDLGLKNRMTPQNLTYSTVNNLSVASESTENEKNFYVYAENWVYLLSTKSPSLYPLLDQIAQSFQYVP